MTVRDKYGGELRKKDLLGLTLDRVTSTLPATTYGALFNITGGRVVMTSIIGEVTTAIQGQTTNLKITSTPTTGTAVDVTANLDTDADVEGSLYGIGVYLSATIGGAGAAAFASTPIVLPIGSVGITTGATSSGSIQWSVTYVPLDDEAFMEVA